MTVYLFAVKRETSFDIFDTEIVTVASNYETAKEQAIKQFVEIFHERPNTLYLISSFLVKQLKSGFVNVLSSETIDK